MTKTLLLSPQPLSRPNDGMRLRGVGLSSALKSVGHLATLCFAQGDEKGDCPLPVFPGEWERLFSPVPSLVRCFRSAEFRQLVEKESQGCDVCYCLGLQMFQYATALASEVPVVLDNINVESNILWGLSRRRSGIKRLYWMFQALKLQRYERWALTRATAVLAISEADKRRFLEIAPTARITVVPPGLYLQSLLSRTTRPKPGRIVFVGALDWHVNVDACNWFAREVFPNLRQAYPEATLRLVGKRPADSVWKLASIPGVSVHADVPEVESFLDEASLVVVPLRFGSGVQNKVIEALAAGKPVVTSPVGLEGLDLTPGIHLLVAEGVEDMGSACLRVLNDAEYAQGLGVRGRRAVAEAYSEGRLCKDIDCFHQQFAGH